MIYAFQCKICNKLYVGKTSDCLSQRVNGHRSKFYHVLKNSDTITEDCDDEHIVGAHLVHGHNIERRKDFNLSYRLFVLAQVNPTMLRTTEQLWINKLKTLRPFGLICWLSCGYPIKALIIYYTFIIITIIGWRFYYSLICFKISLFFSLAVLLTILKLVQLCKSVARTVAFNRKYTYLKSI